MAPRSPLRNAPLHTPNNPRSMREGYSPVRCRRVRPPLRGSLARVNSHLMILAVATEPRSGGEARSGGVRGEQRPVRHTTGGIHGTKGPRADESLRAPA